VCTAEISFESIELTGATQKEERNVLFAVVSTSELDPLDARAASMAPDFPSVIAIH
jgi:hypothetical protein